MQTIVKGVFRHSEFGVFWFQMLYFIFWVVFLLFVVFAIPVVSMLEKRKYRAAMADQNGGVAEELGDGEAAMEEPAEVESMEMGGDDLGGFEDTTPAGGDDFSAFDEEFK